MGWRAEKIKKKNPSFSKSRKTFDVFSRDGRGGKKGGGGGVDFKSA